MAANDSKRDTTGGNTKVQKRRVKNSSADVQVNSIRRRKRELLSRINYGNTFTAVVLPFLGMVYLFHYSIPIIPSNPSTFYFSFFYFHFTMLAFTSGYHKYFTHKTFKVKFNLVQYYFSIFGASIGIGPVRWWAGLHRAHHHYTDDTERDPYSIKRGFLWAQYGWLLKKLKSGFYDGFIEQEFPTANVISLEERDGVAVNEVSVEDSGVGANEVFDGDEEDVTESDADMFAILTWQQRYYMPLFCLTSIIIPTLITKFICQDSYTNGLLYPGIFRMFLCQVCLLTTESLCHSKNIQVTIPTQPFNDKNSSINCNNPLFSLLTYGQGHDNFHHEFPHDYRGSSSITAYDPTKWFIKIMEKLGLVHQLCKSPDNLITQLKIQQQQHVLNRMRSQLNWGTPISKLPLITPKDFKRIIASSSNKDRIYIVISDIIHDITPFMDQHPGGIPLLKASHGKDASQAFYGGVYGHLTAAINLLATMRIGVLDTGNREDVWQRVVFEEGDVVDNDERTKAYQTAEAA